MSLRSNFSDQLLSDALPLLDALVVSGYDQLPDLIPMVFNEIGSSRWGEQSSTLSGIKAAPEAAEGAAVEFDDPIQGYDKTYQHSTYKIAVGFEQELVEDDRLDVVGKTLKSLGKSMHQTRQIMGASVLNNGFSDTGPDGQSLFYSAHPILGGGTYGNRPSTEIALSVAGLREMEVDFMNQVDDRNINALVAPKLLIVPPDLKHVAKELLRSVDRPDTANRAMNTFKDEDYQLAILPYLTSVSAWFALADKGDHELRFYNRVAPSTKSWVDEKTGTMNTQIRCRFSQGYSDWKGTWGTTG